MTTVDRDASTDDDTTAETLSGFLAWKDSESYWPPTLEEVWDAAVSYERNTDSQTIAVAIRAGETAERHEVIAKVEKMLKVPGRSAVELLELLKWLRKRDKEVNG